VQSIDYIKLEELKLNTEQIREIVTKVTQEVLERGGGGAVSGTYTDLAPASLASYIDHTLLKPESSIE